MLASTPVLATLMFAGASVAHAFSMTSHAHLCNAAQRSPAAVSMSCIEIYTSARCPHCVTAKEFLASQGVSYVEVDVRADQLNMGTMLVRTKGLSTVPQIFIDDEHIGGCSDMLDAARAGSLVLERNAPSARDHKFYYDGLIQLLRKNGQSMPSLSLA